jgi:S-adenosylmethionine hydrolase
MIFRKDGESFKFGAEKITEAVEITNQDFMLQPVSNTFHGRDIFAPAAAYCSTGSAMKSFGERISSIRQLDIPPVTLSDSRTITGSVVYADHFGNLITNIDTEYIQALSKKLKKELRGIKIGDHTIDRLNKCYEESTQGEILAIISSYDTLEISINCGRADDLITGWKDLPVEVKF